MFAAPILRNAASSSSSTATAPAFSQAHKSYVKSLYRRYLNNSLDWCIRRDVWRDRAIEIRVEFERHRNVRNPRELANLFEKAERELKRIQHPDPHRRKFPTNRLRGFFEAQQTNASRATVRTDILIFLCFAAPQNLTAAMFEGGTKWERNLPPPMFSEAEKKAALQQHH